MISSNWSSSQFSDEQCGEILRDLTVVILTRNRPGMLRGVIEYWSRWPVSILILDGSDEILDISSLESGAARISVYSKVDLSDRFQYAASNIRTPFSCLHADDDFTLARGTARAIEWLRENSDFTCVSSDVLLFDAKPQSWSAPPGRDVISDNPRDRLVEHFSDYRFSYFYGIQRTIELCVALQAVATATGNQEYLKRPNGSAGFELGMEICGASLGKLGKSPEVLLLKRMENTPYYMEAQSPNEWLEDPETQVAVRAWRGALSAELSPNVGCDDATVDGWLLEAMDRFCGRERAKANSRPLAERLVHGIAIRIRPRAPAAPGGHTAGRQPWLARVHYGAYGALRSTFRASTRRFPLVGTPKTIGIDATNLDRADLMEVNAILDAEYAEAVRKERGQEVR